MEDAAASSPAVFRRVRAGNAYDETVDHLLEVIKLGRLSYGERLPPERELATIMGVSRVTLRQAMASLRHAGYVQILRGRFGGTFVAYRPSPDQIDAIRIASRLGATLEDALTCRRVVEPGSIEVVAHARLTSARRAALLERLAEVEAATIEQYRQADSRLHLLLAECTGSAMLIRAVAEIHIVLNDLLGALPPSDGLSASGKHSHRQIVEAVLANDALRAKRAMQGHVDATASLLRRFVQ